MLRSGAVRAVSPYAIAPATNIIVVIAVIFIVPSRSLLRRKREWKTGTARKEISSDDIISFQPGFMGDSQSSETTQLLRAWAGGDQAALEQLAPRVYNELRRIAGYCMQNEHPGRTIQTTALVHEAYFKLIDVKNVNWQHRAHFFAISAQIMRHILLDRARRRVAAKRGGVQPKVNLDELPEIGSNRARELIALDDALTALAERDERKARVIELRFFGGLSVEETAEVLKVSADTVLRDWRLARAWLLAELQER
jgi:RNA polymerase sigma factor (TIGR02999 family)